MLRNLIKSPFGHEMSLAVLSPWRKLTHYLGWIDCTDTYGMYLKRIKPYVSFQNLKRRISERQKAINKKGVRVNVV